MIALEREVSATVGEFLHGLRLAFPAGVAADGPRIRVADGPAAMEIELAPLPERRIALLRLPNMRVSIRFTAGSAEDQRAMLARMDRAMQRGGG